MVQSHPMKVNLYYTLKCLQHQKNFMNLKYKKNQINFEWRTKTLIRRNPPNPERPLLLLQCHMAMFTTLFKYEGIFECLLKMVGTLHLIYFNLPFTYTAGCPIRCHYLWIDAKWRASGTTSDRGVDSGDGSGEVLHIGHVACILIHASIHATWNA